MMHGLLASFIKSFFLCGHNHFKQLQPSGISVATQEVVRGGCDCHSGALEAALGGNMLCWESSRTMPLDFHSPTDLSTEGLPGAVDITLGKP